MIPIINLGNNPIINRCLSLIPFLFLHTFLFAQVKTDKTFFSVRALIQSDFQTADFKDIRFPYEFKKHSTTTVNWGADLLIGKEMLINWNVYIGIGYFRNKFNFKRAYDHKLLNPGTDSIQLGTSTTDYVFNLLRIPIGINYIISKKDKYKIDMGIENVFNFSLQQVYNGAKPFPNSNNKYSKFKYYGNSILVLVRISKEVYRNSYLILSPYIRILNIYKRKDPFLFEHNSTPYSRSFDATGISLIHSFNLKNH